MRVLSILLISCASGGCRLGNMADSSSTPSPSPIPTSTFREAEELHRRISQGGEVPSASIARRTRGHSMPPNTTEHADFDVQLIEPQIHSPGRHSAPGRLGPPGSPSSVSSIKSCSTGSITGSVAVSEVLALTVCPICFLPPLNPHAAITPCGHTFCSSCIEKWMDTQPGRPK